MSHLKDSCALFVMRFHVSLGFLSTSVLGYFSYIDTSNYLLKIIHKNWFRRITLAMFHYQVEK